MGRHFLILLDTCALLWLAAGSGRMSEEVRARIDSEPVDRVIIATAERMQSIVVTADSRFPAYGIRLMV